MLNGIQDDVSLEFLSQVEKKAFERKLFLFCLGVGLSNNGDDLTFESEYLHMIYNQLRYSSQHFLTPDCIYRLKRRHDDVQGSEDINL